MSSDTETQQPEETYSRPPQKRYEDRSVAALVLGLVGFVPYVGFVAAILAIVFGRGTMNGIREGDVLESRRGMANAGFILGIVVLSLYALYLLFIIVVLLFLSTASIALTP